MIVYTTMTDEEYEDLITSYQFITNVQFTNTDQVKTCIEYCKAKERLSEDTLDYLLEKINILKNGLEITESNEDRETVGVIDNEGG